LSFNAVFLEEVKLIDGATETTNPSLFERSACDQLSHVYFPSLWRPFGLSEEEGGQSRADNQEQYDEDPWRGVVVVRRQAAGMQSSC